MQDYGKEVNAKAEEKPAEDKFTAKKRQEIEEEKAMLKNAVNIRNKMNMWDKQAEQQQQQQQQQQELERRRASTSQQKYGKQLQLDRENHGDKAVSSAADRSEPRKLTSIMSIFQQKNAPSEPPRNRIVLNTAPAKKWAPVTTNSLQRTVKPESKNYDLYSKVKRSKSREWKRDTLKRTKSRGSCDPEPSPEVPAKTNDAFQQRQPQATFSTPTPPVLPPPPPPPAPPFLSKQLPVITPIFANQPKPTSTTPTPPPPPLPTPPSAHLRSKVNVTSAPPTQLPPPPPPPTSSATLSQPQTPARPLSPYNNGKDTPQQLTSALKPTPTASSSSSRSVSPISTLQPNVATTKPTKNNNLLFNKPSPEPPITAAKQLNHVQLPANNRLDQLKMNRFNNGNAASSMDKCVDYGRMATAKPPESSFKPVVRHIPIQREPAEDEEEEEVSLECSEEEEEEEESSSEESSSEESPQISSDGKGLTRSSTMEILKLIKAKNNENEKLQAVEEEDEDKEIDMLLIGLQKEGVENIDWGEFGIELAEVKDIIQNNQDGEEESEEEESEESEESEEEEESD